MQRLEACPDDAPPPAGRLDPRTNKLGYAEAGVTSDRLFSADFPLRYLLLIVRVWSKEKRFSSLTAPQGLRIVRSGVGWSNVGGSPLTLDIQTIGGVRGPLGG